MTLALNYEALHKIEFSEATVRGSFNVKHGNRFPLRRLRMTLSTHVFENVV